MSGMGLWLMRGQEIAGVGVFGFSEKTVTLSNSEGFFLYVGAFVATMLIISLVAKTIELATR
jgi:hypothetical protein